MTQRTEVYFNFIPNIFGFITYRAPVDPPARPSFRGTTTQPSQMGNFKHQSIRSTDRNDRDKDGEKERERDMRDKEGQERLRNVCFVVPFPIFPHHILSSYRTSMTATALLFPLTQRILESRRERLQLISILGRQELAIVMDRLTLHHVARSQEKVQRRRQ